MLFAKFQRKKALNIGQPTRLLLLLILGFSVNLLFMNTPSLAWNTSPTVNTAIATDLNTENYVEVVSDGQGGAIVVWHHFNNSNDQDIRAQRINTNGDFLWQSTVTAAIGDQYELKVAGDSEGGVIVAWIDRRAAGSGSNTDIYAQRVDKDGNVLWGANGLAIATTTSQEHNLNIDVDAVGNTFLIWNKISFPNGVLFQSYIQRVDKDGTLAWPANGIEAVNSSSDPSPVITFDGSGGTIIAYRKNGGIDAKRINAVGNEMWSTVIANDAAALQYTPTISHSNNGALIVWIDRKNSEDAIYAQNINLQGLKLNNSWPNDGKLIKARSVNGSSVLVDSYSLKLAFDSLHANYFIIWNQQSSSNAVYAQLIQSGTAAVSWAGNGLLVSISDGSPDPRILPDGGNSTAIVTWTDTSLAGNSNIHAQRIDSNGINGAAKIISNAAQNQLRSAITTDGDRGAIIVWDDTRSTTSSDIYADRYLKDASLGDNELCFPIKTTLTKLSIVCL